ncbi:MAG: hypothetical protein ACRELX_09495 [Longimicrobiales bacterium]
MRRLQATRRLIPLDRFDDYLAGWERLRAAATDAGGRAWMFRGSAHQDHFIEFLEWEDAAPALPERALVADASRALDESFGAGHTDEWEEVPTP